MSLFATRRQKKATRFETSRAGSFSSKYEQQAPPDASILPRIRRPLEAQIKKSEAAAVVNLFFNKMVDALANGDRIEIRRLCSFYVKKYKPYTGRNPKTGKKVKVKPKKLPFFKPGIELKERVDNK